MNIIGWISSWFNPPSAPLPVNPAPEPPEPVVVPRTMTPSEKNLWNTWKSAVPSEASLNDAAHVANQIISNMPIYEKVSQDLGGLIPGYFIGCLHYRENSMLSLRAYLGNGQMIIGAGRKTSIVPKDRGPFAQFEDGAVDALLYQGFDKIEYWDVTVCLDRAERWNGLGYRKRGVASPYLWSMTSAYKKGLFTSDGVYDANAVDKEFGVAVILHALKKRGVDLIEVEPLDA